MSWTARVAKFRQVSDEVARREGPEVVATHRIADKNIPRMARYIETVLANLREAVTPGLVGRALDSGAPIAMIDRWLDEHLEELVPVAKAEIPPDINATYGAIIGEAGELWTSLHAGEFVFDHIDPETVNAAKRSAAAMVTGVRSEVRSAIQEAIVGSVSGNLTRQQTVRVVRGAVGMSGPQARAYANLASAAYAGQGPMTNAERALFSRAQGFKLQGQTRLKRNMNPAAIRRMLDQYERRAIAHRAQTIARTETMRASNLGKLQGARQFVAATNNTRLVLEWVTTFDDRTCQICVGLDGKVVDDGTAFVSNIGQELATETPPIHPRCRCVLDTRTEIVDTPV